MVIKPLGRLSSFQVGCLVRRPCLISYRMALANWYFIQSLSLLCTTADLTFPHPHLIAMLFMPIQPACAFYGPIVKVPFLLANGIFTFRGLTPPGKPPSTREQQKAESSPDVVLQHPMMHKVRYAPRITSKMRHRYCVRLLGLITNILRTPLVLLLWYLLRRSRTHPRPPPLVVLRGIHTPLHAPICAVGRLTAHAALCGRVCARDRRRAPPHAVLP